MSQDESSELPSLSQNVGTPPNVLPRFSVSSQYTPNSSRPHSPTSTPQSFVLAQLELLVGKEYTQSAILPDGVHRVTVVSSPVPTLVFGTEAPARKKEQQKGDAEELVVDIVPLEGEATDGTDPSSFAPSFPDESQPKNLTPRNGNNPFHSAPSQLSSGVTESSGRELNSTSDLRPAGEIEMTKIGNTPPSESDTKEETGPADFSAWLCFTNPQDAACAAKSVSAYVHSFADGNNISQHRYIDSHIFLTDSRR